MEAISVFRPAKIQKSGGISNTVVCIRGLICSKLTPEVLDLLIKKVILSPDDRRRFNASQFKIIEPIMGVSKKMIVIEDPLKNYLLCALNP